MGMAFSNETKRQKSGNKNAFNYDDRINVILRSTLQKIQ